MDWGSSSSESSSESDFEEGGAAAIRNRFLKKNTEKDEDEERDKRRTKRREERVRTGKVSKKDQADDGGEWETVRTKGAAASDKPKMFAKVRKCHHFLFYYFICLQPLEF